jgi:Rad3-related DNA helicase
LDQEIRDIEAIHQQVQRKKEKMLRLADLQRKIDEADEEIRHLTQNDQDQRPQYRELHQESQSIKMNGTMIFTMVTLLSMMLLLWQQNCRPPRGHHLTSHLSSPCMMGIHIQNSS